MYRKAAKEVLIETMFVLMKKKQIDAITVKDILKTSHVSKTTFYRNYHDKYELMNSCYDAKIGGMIEDVVEATSCWQELLEETFRFYTENSAFMINGFKSMDPYALDNFIFKYAYDFYSRAYMQAKNIDYLPDEIEEAIWFNMGGSVALLRKWLMNGMKTPYREEAQRHFKFMPEPLREIFDK